MLRKISVNIKVTTICDQQLCSTQQLVSLSEEIYNIADIIYIFPLWEP